MVKVKPKGGMEKGQQGVFRTFWPERAMVVER
jgi:hypothetical protein